MEILNLSTIENSTLKNQYIEQIKDIFYLCSAVKIFKSQDHKDSFFQKWCGDYLKLSQNNFYVAIEDGFVLGYLSGHLDSKQAIEDFIIPGPEIYVDCYDKFPAHFHINCHPKSQGKGVGRKLVDRFSQELVKHNIKGVHLITSTDADNLGFYRALGFNNEFPRAFNKIELLLMAKTI